jgi:hypothetical protein
MLSPEEYVAKQKKEARLIHKVPDRRKVADILRRLAPAFGYSPYLVSRTWDTSEDGEDLLQAARRDPQEGHLVPEGLKILGHKGLTFNDILAMKFHKKSWWKVFISMVGVHGEAIWVLPIKHNGYWVIHNTTIDPDRRLQAIEIPAITAGLNHIQVIRLELFIKEKRDVG